jgi:glycosyltransferase involved in cell wall biosynthesis
MGIVDPDAIVVDEIPAARRSLRVALVSETYPPEVNGVATTIERIVDGLHLRNHELQLVRPRQAAGDRGDRGERFEQVLLGALPIPRYPHLRMGVPSKRALVALWSRRRPDLVHIATEGPLGWSALQAATTLKLPVTSDFRTNFHAYSRHYGVGWLAKPIVAYLRKFHNRTARTMVPTPALRDELVAHGFRNLRVVARGVDARRFDPARRSAALRRQWGVGDDGRAVLFVGRLAPEKNLAALVAAFDAMRAVDPALRLVLVGDGPARADLGRACPDAVFAGQRTGEDLVAHYASGDIFVFPSLTETYGNVTPEAMASGLAVLAFEHAAAAQLIRSGWNGLLAPCGDSAAFVRAAARLAGDRALAAELGRRARESALSLDWERVVAQIEAVFLEALHTPEACAAAPALRPGAA